MRLFIAEKPTVAKDIVEALGGGFDRKEGYYVKGSDIVTNCFGHLLTTVEPEVYNESYKTWKLEDLPLNLYPLQYKPIESSKDHTKKVIELIKQADEIVHAGDPDDEGQLLVDELLYYTGFNKPVKRLLINDNNINAVKKSIDNITDNKQYYPIYLKALARQTGDLIYGLSMTRAYTISARNNGYNGVLSVGRVQTPILGLIVRRYLANQSHESSFFYTAVAQFNLENQENLFARLIIPEDLEKDDKGRAINEQQINDIVAFCTDKRGTVTKAVIKQREEAPPLPFNLATLQQHANKKFKMTAARTLEITQDLREKYKAITYNRSDCSYLSEEQYKDAEHVISALMFEVLPNDVYVDFSIKSKCFNDAKITAHTAIIPTANAPDIEKLTQEEKDIYLSIVDRYVIQFMPNRTYDEATGEITIDKYSFGYREIKTTSAGFTAYFKPESDNEDPAQESSIFNLIRALVINNELACPIVELNKKKTTPPPLFTEATLMNALTRIADFVTDEKVKKVLKEKDKDSTEENGGIGTPATRSAIIELLKTRNYIALEKDKLIPTELGLNFFNSLPEDATLPNLTALWTERFNDIASGLLKLDDFVELLNSELKALIVSAETNKAITSHLDISCPNCSNPMRETAKTFSCSNADCSFKVWKEIAGKKLTLSQFETLIKKRITSEIKGFKSKTDKTFDAKLKLVDTTTGKVEFQFDNKPKKKK